MSHKPLLPLSESILEYLLEYHDFTFHHLNRFFKNHTQEEIIATVDELEENDLVDFVHHDPREPDEKHLRNIDIETIEGRAIMP